jgi:hypothetical protein
MLALSELNNHRKIENPRDSIEKRHRLKTTMGIRVNNLDQKPKSMLDKILGPKMSEIIYMRIRKSMA